MTEPPLRVQPVPPQLASAAAAAAGGPSLEHPSTIPLTVEGDVVRDAEGRVLLEQLHPNLQLNSSLSRFGALVFGARSANGAAHAWDLTVGRVSEGARAFGWLEGGVEGSSSRIGSGGLGWSGGCWVCCSSLSMVCYTGVGGPRCESGGLCWVLTVGRVSEAAGGEGLWSVFGEGGSKGRQLHWCVSWEGGVEISTDVSRESDLGGKIDDWLKGGGGRGGHSGCSGGRAATVGGGGGVRDTAAALVRGGGLLGSCTKRVVSILAERQWWWPVMQQLTDTCAAYVHMQLNYKRCPASACNKLCSPTYCNCSPLSPSLSLAVCMSCCMCGCLCVCSSSSSATWPVRATSCGG